MNHDVFLSHSHTDKVYADAICHHLEASSVRCWVAPRDIRPSEDWAAAIINALDTSKILVLIFSSGSNSSPQVRREVERAVNKGLIILPFRIENVPLSKSLEYFISTQHWLDAINGSVEENLKKLAENVSVLLGHASDLPIVAAVLPEMRATSATPLAEAVPVHSFSPEIMATLETLLAQVLGPIAKFLVKRALAANLSPQDFISALSHEIDDESERKQFVTRSNAAIR